MPVSALNGCVEAKQICHCEAPVRPDAWTAALSICSEAVKRALGRATPEGLKTSKLTGSDTRW